MDVSQHVDSNHDFAIATSDDPPSLETCFQYRVSSEKNGNIGERNLKLNIHFQKADYPSVSSGKPAMFSYAIKRARLEVSLSSAGIGIEDIVPIDEFQVVTQNSVKSSKTNELLLKAGGDFHFTDATYGAKGYGGVDKKKAQFSEKETKTYYSSIEYRHLSDQLMYWLFSPNEGRDFLLSTLSNQPLGKIKSYGKNSKAQSQIMVWEKDIESIAPYHLKKMGLLGLVTYKIQRAAIAREMSKGSVQKIIL